jgi:hypothetical protein
VLFSNAPANSPFLNNTRIEGIRRIDCGPWTTTSIVRRNTTVTICTANGSGEDSSQARERMQIYGVDPFRTGGVYQFVLYILSAWRWLWFICRIARSLPAHELFSLGSGATQCILDETGSFRLRSKVSLSTRGPRLFETLADTRKQS